jgi:hypothetical protein
LAQLLTFVVSKFGYFLRRQCIFLLLQLL